MPSLRCLVPVAALASAGAAQAGALPGAIFANGFEPLPVVTVFDVQSGVAAGVVLLQDRVVTARSRDQRHLWIADALTAAPFEGVFVFRGTGAEPLGAEVAIGARVDVTGSVAEFDIGTPPAGDTLTELDRAVVTLAGAPVAAPVPIVFDSVAQLVAIDAGEAWEGVLVRVDNVRVTGFDSGNRVNVRDSGTPQTSFVIDDDAFAYPLPALDTCYASVTGIMHINLQDDQRRLLPRAASDFVPGAACD